MKKKSARKVSKKTSKASRPVAKRAVAKKAKPRAAKPTAAKAPVTPDTGEKLTFNHAMIYVKDVDRGTRFYRDLMGFKLIEDVRYEGTAVYARLRAPGGDGTIALHMAGPGASLASDGVRLYFEIRDLEGFAAGSSKGASTLPRCRA